MAAGGGEWAWPSSLSLLYFYYNLICELLHVMIISPKVLEVHPLGSTSGHTIIGRAKRAPHWGVQSRFRVIYICIYICMSVCLVCQINCVGGIT